MTCREVRQYMVAFLDSELDAHLSVELQQHLEHCAACARDAEIERSIRSHLVRQSAVGNPPLPFDVEHWRNQLRQDRATRSSPPRRRWMHITIAAVAASVAILVGVWALHGWLSNFASGTPTFSDLLIDDLEHLERESTPTEVKADRPEPIIAWIREKTQWDAKVPLISDVRYRLVGAHQCTISGRRAILVLYRVDGQSASVVILPSSPSDLATMRVAEKADYAVDRCRGYTIVASRDGALTYAAIGKVSEVQLARLVPETNQGLGRPAG